MTRAAPLAPEERRAAIIAATERLLVTKGKSVSTREIAEAAGIAEGTIFRVFPSKEAIIDAIFEDATDPETGRDEIEALGRHEILEDCLTELAAILQSRVARVLALFGVVGFRRPLSFEDAHERREAGFAMIAEVLRPHAERLRMTPEVAARHFQGVVLAHTHPMLIDKPELDPARLVDFALYGMLERADRDADTVQEKVK